MANCYGELINCEKAVNVQFMQELVNASRVSSCVEINGGPAHSDSCASASTNDYIPTYSELSSASIAPLRVTNENPELDKNGFVYTIGTRSTSECFEGDIPQNAALKRSEISFETTSAISNTHTVNIAPTHCDWSYDVTETDRWQRDSYKCNENGISVSSNPITNSTTHSGELKRTSSFTTSSISDVSKNVNFIDNKWGYEFETVVLTSTTSADCSTTYSAETVLSLDKYDYGYKFSCPQIVPCTGDTYDIINISGFSEIAGCLSALTLDITYTNIEDGEGSPTLLSGDTWNTLGTGTVTGETISIKIPKNTTGKPSGKIDVKATVWGDTFTNTLEFSRNLCEWTPKYSPSNECSVLMGDEEWIYDNEYIHNFKNN